MTASKTIRAVLVHLRRTVERALHHLTVASATAHAPGSAEVTMPAQSTVVRAVRLREAGGAIQPRQRNLRSFSMKSETDAAIRHARRNASLTVAAGVLPRNYVRSCNPSRLAIELNHGKKSVGFDSRATNDNDRTCATYLWRTAGWLRAERNDERGVQCLLLRHVERHTREAWDWRNSMSNLRNTKDRERHDSGDE